ncbi:MAG TPA: mechanosensitive ion channel protein MscS [Cyanobacteria bacterium UBA8156]|jgi:small-conductance mechanosensitive channel|nr:mechanosensitive ion channel protein MscS [Cyanobacteria bacterium UBA8156]
MQQLHFARWVTLTFGSAILATVVSSDSNTMVSELAQQRFLNNTLSSYATVVTVVLAGLLGIRLVTASLFPLLYRWVALTDSLMDDALVQYSKTYVVPFAYGLVVYNGIQGLNLHPSLDRLLDVTVLAAATLVATRLLQLLVVNALRLWWQQSRGEANSEASLHLLTPAIDVAMWTIAAIFFLQNLGLNLTGLLASLGVGGVALALASRSVFEDLFNYYTIVLDRPFEIGDFLVIDESEFMGTVERVGVKSTRLRSLGGEELIFPNTYLTTHRLRNYRRMYRRRVCFHFGVEYNTPPDVLSSIPDVVRGIVETVAGTLFDRCHFYQYGNSSLDFETVYFVLDRDYNLYMDLHQQVCLGIYRAFTERGIAFAFPTRTVHIQIEEEKP